MLNSSVNLIIYAKLYIRWLLQDSLRVELSLEIYMSLFFFFTKQFLFLKILKPFFKKQLILLLKCSWFVFFFFYSLQAR